LFVSAGRMLGGLMCVWCLLPQPVHADPRASLRHALTHHASFDQSLSADFSRGDPVMYAFSTAAERSAGGSPAKFGDSVQIVGKAGRFGGALWREKKDTLTLFYRQDGILDYDPADWSGTVSLWLRISPDDDLLPGYCDPVQVTGGRSKTGFIFLEWSRDHTPRKFRYAVLPQVERWNPDGLGWEELAEDKRPMVQLNDAPFSRNTWTHVAFTFDRLNAGKAASGRLYLNGELQGTIAGWDLILGWTPGDVLLALGANYIGFMDDLAVFDRALDGNEVRALYRLPNGVEDLH
jgi:hypothetical protein